MTVTIDARCCDGCDKVRIEEHRTCIACLRDFCGEEGDGAACCAATKMAHYEVSPNYTDSRRRGHYCLECDARLRAEGADELHTAYLKIAEIRRLRDALAKLEPMQKLTTDHINLLYDRWREKQGKK